MGVTFPGLVDSSLYERLGGGRAIAAIARDIVTLHRKNPLIRDRFEGVDCAALENHVRAFICAGTGGTEIYEGRDMPTTHAGMNLNERDLIAAIDDVLLALMQNGVGDAERMEVLAILYSLKDDVLFK